MVKQQTNIKSELGAYINTALHIIPLHPKSKVPIPKKWTEAATIDPTMIQRWQNASPDCNWGMVTGQISGVFVVDIDVKNGGDATWDRLTKDKDLPKTVIVNTGGGGQHLYFKYPALGIQNSAGKVGKGIDIRAEGGQVVIPPSTHANGKNYTFAPGLAVGEVPIAKAPKWLLNLAETGGEVDCGGAIGDPLIPGQRNNQIYTQALKLARQGALQEMAVTAMIVWAKTQNENLPKSEIEATVASAYKAHEVEKTRASAMDGVELSDRGNAERLIRQANGHILYVHGLDWHVWLGKHWCRDEEGIRTAGMAHGAMQEWQEDILAELVTVTDRNLQQKYYKLHQWATNSKNKSKTTDMIWSARPIPGVYVPDTVMNGPDTTFLFNVDNGILDLRTGKLHDHDPSWHISKLSHTRYVKTAKCPTFLETLNLAFDGNKELISYFQRCLGYSLSASIAENVFFILWGPDGRNGKSTIMETIARVMGDDYSQMSDPKVITSSNNTENYVNSSLAALVGARLVSMNELPPGAVLDESRVKQITGGDTMRTKFLYTDGFTFIPAFKIFLRTNEKPLIHGASSAIWRRVRCIPFVHPIPIDKIKSRDVVDTALANEYEGILAWMVRGFQDWYNNGNPSLQDPKIVLETGSEYREASDVVSQFWAECVIASENKDDFVSHRALYQAFRDWYDQQGLKYCMSAPFFTRRVADRLNQHVMIRKGGAGNQVVVWQGITLNPESGVGMMGDMLR